MGRAAVLRIYTRWNRHGGSGVKAVKAAVSPMCKRLSHRISVPVAIVGLLVAGCRSRPATVATPDAARATAQAAEYAARGDASFRGLHLYAWRQAAALYEKAYSLKRDESVRDRLLLTRFLIMTRQMDEDIPDPKLDDTVKDLCSNPAGERGTLLCTLAEWYRKGIWLKPADGESPRKIRFDRSLFEGVSAAVGAYLYSFCAHADLLATVPEGLEAAAEQYKDTPLFTYLDFQRRGPQKLAEFEKAVPEFAELDEYLGEDAFQKRRYNAARAYFRKALELIPEYTRSLNGIGNVYSFALEDYEKAIEYYDAVLKIYPMNTAALFGKGAALHHLGRFGESISILDAMLRTDLWRRGYTDARTVQYYQGEGRHLLAYNYYLMKNPARARELVNAAKTYLPNSEEINYLSGLLYFEAGDIDSAQADFLKVIERGNSNCSAMRYLGIIYHRKKGMVDAETAADARMPAGGEYDRLRKTIDRQFSGKESGEKRALNYFLSSCDCMDRTVRSLQDQIRSIPGMDLEEGEKLVLRGRVEKKLIEYRLASDSMIQSMLTTVSGEETEGKQVYVKLMSDILMRIRNSSP